MNLGLALSGYGLAQPELRAQQQARDAAAQQLLASKILSQPGVNFNDPNSILQALRTTQGGRVDPNAMGAIADIEKSTYHPQVILGRENVATQSNQTKEDIASQNNQTKLNVAQLYEQGRNSRAYNTVKMQYDKMSSNELQRQLSTLSTQIASGVGDTSDLSTKYAATYDLVNQRRKSAGLNNTVPHPSLPPGDNIEPGENAMPNQISEAAPPDIMKPEGTVANGGPGNTWKVIGGKWVLQKD